MDDAPASSLLIAARRHDAGMWRGYWGLALVVLVGWAAAGQVRAEYRSLVAVNENMSAGRAHPFVLIDEGELRALRALIDRDDAARQAFDNGLRLDAEKALRDLERLRREARIVLPAAGRAHSRLAVDLRNMALYHGLTGESAYAEAGRALLKAYADQYTGFPIAGRQAGRVTAQTLNEAEWLFNIAWAYDLLHGEIPVEERRDIEQDLLRAAVEVIGRGSGAIHNWVCWHNAGIGITGLVLEDEEIYGKAIWGKLGWVDQLTRGLRDDGLWLEQSIAYHAFGMHAMTLLAEAAHRYGYDLYGIDAGGRSLRAMYDAPFFHAFSDATHPVVGDSELERSLGRTEELWNYAFATRRYDDTKYRWLLESFPPSLRADRRMPLLLRLGVLDGAVGGTGPATFTIGTGSFAAAGRNVLGSTLFPDSGIGILRGPAWEPQAPEVAMLFKPHGTLTGHQHPDNLSIQWQQGGHRWVPATGKWASYADPIHLDYIIHTLSDNALIVDRASQYPQLDHHQRGRVDERGRTSRGILDGFAVGPLFAYMHASSSNLYDGVDLRRRVLHADRYTLDLASATSGTEHTYDWVLHVDGELDHTSASLAASDSPLGTTAGYGRLTNLRRGLVGGMWLTSWRRGGDTFRLSVSAPEGAEAVVAEGPWKGGTLPLALATVTGRHAGFVSLLEAGGDSPAAELVEVRRGEPGLRSGLVRVRGEGFTDHVAWHPEPQEIRVANLACHAAVAAVREGPSSSASDALLVGVTEVEAGDLRIRLDRATDLGWRKVDASLALLMFSGGDEVGVRLRIPAGWTLYRLGGDGVAEGPVEGVMAGSEITFTAAGDTCYAIASDEEALSGLPTLRKDVNPRKHQDTR